jgi:adenine-specific DNA-methyltransferase
MLKTINVNLNRAAYPKINTKTLESLPIIRNSHLEMQLIELVKELDPEISLKDENSAIIDKIDQLVYELYGLTEEEIAIVEGRKPVNLEEANSITA